MDVSLYQQKNQTQMSPFEKYLTSESCPMLHITACEVYAAASTLGEPGCSYSLTQFGESYYIYLNGKTIRVSDHDCGKYRMEDQYQIRINQAFNAYSIEVHCFPERFEAVKILMDESHGESTCHVNSYKHNPENEILEYFTTKRGEPFLRFRYTKRFYRTEMRRIA